MRREKNETKLMVDVNILGEVLTITSTSSPDYIRSVARYIDDKMAQLNQLYPRMSRTKIFALGAMNLADDLLKMRQELEMLKAEKDMVEKERDEARQLMERAQRLAQHYQGKYEELALLLEEGGNE